MGGDSGSALLPPRPDRDTGLPAPPHDPTLVRDAPEGPTGRIRELRGRDAGPQGAIGAVGALAVPGCLLFGPVGVGPGRSAGRGTAVPAGIAVGVALVVAAGWSVRNRARPAFPLGRAIGHLGRD